MNRENLWRYYLLGALLSLAPLLIVYQLVHIQLDPTITEFFRGEQKIYEGQPVEIEPVRGLIMDRNGDILAANKVVYEVGVNLVDVKNPHTIALTMNVVLGMDYSLALGIASEPASETAVYRRLFDNISEEQMTQLDALIDQMNAEYGGHRGKDVPSLNGLVFRPHLQRTYPEKTLASPLLGFVNGEGLGYYGVEGYYNSFLAGTPKKIRILNDPNQAQELPDVPDGVSLVLTIDRSIQSSMENLVDWAMGEYGAESATIVVLDPKTGEILALATTPRMDLNEFWRSKDIFPSGTPFDRGVSQAYEPGSVFKVLTMLAALDSGAVTPETEFVDRGAIEVGGAIIYNWNRGGWGPQTMLGCMEHSLNVCLAWVATQIGAKDFYSYLEKFGIGRLTGVELAGETEGRLKVPGDADWYDADLGVNAFGQGVSATPIQMAAAISAAANGGRMMQPHIVRSIINKGYQQDIEPRVAGAVVKPETAQTLTEMLAQSLEIESSDALVPGYRIAGKTGTAEIPTPLGYTSNDTNASFVGWGPVDDPKFLVYVWLEKPTASPWGSVVAAPVFREAVEQLVVLMNIPPDEVRHQLYGQ
jgi:cell division protein FtsI/penicillin-binding protein 2